ncbi:MAG: hypothetical protein KAS94_00855 [Desulfobulbaceae bacterium]|nr:hypothetical protein [Desulfobulbaceae bacterium]
MKKNIFTIIGLVVAVSYWIFESSMHYFVFNGTSFELMPAEINEIWMRLCVLLIIVLFGVFADVFSRKLVAKEKQLEATHIYESMLRATHHILNNLLNQMQLFKLEASKSKDFDRKIINYFDISVNEASDLIEELSKVENITRESIVTSVDPNKPKIPSNKVNSADSENCATE